MSTKRFCDICGAEIRSDHSHGGNVHGETTLRGRESKRPYPVSVEIQLSFSDGKPDMCTACVFKAVRQIDPMPIGIEGTA